MLYTTLSLNTYWRTLMEQIEDIYSYYTLALDRIPLDHPHFNEIKTLLIDQVNDDLSDYGTTYHVTD